MALAAITLLALGLRLAHLATASLWYDEGNTLGVAAWTPYPWRLLDTDWTAEPPLFLIATYFWFALGKLFVAPGTYACDFWLRLLPCLLGVATVPLSYRVGRSFTGQKGSGLVAAFLVALSPFHLFYAQELRAYTSMLVLALGAMLFLLSALRRGRRRDWAGLTILLTLSLYNHYSTVWLVIVFNLCFLVHLLERLSVDPKSLGDLGRQTLRWSLSQIVVAILAFPALLQVWHINRMTAAMTATWYPPLRWRAGLLTIKAFFAGYSSNAAAYYVLSAAAFVCVAAGLIALRRRREELVFLLLIFVTPIVGNLAIWHSRSFSFYEHRLFIVSSVACFVLVGAGVCMLRRPWGRATAIGVFGAAMLPCIGDYYAERLHPLTEHRLGARVKADLRSAAEHIQSNWKEGDYLAHFSHLTYPSMAYYYLSDRQQSTLSFTRHDELGLIESYAFPNSWRHLGMLPERLDVVADRAARLWLAESWWEPEETPPWAQLYTGWLDRHGVREENRAFHAVTLYRYNLSRRPGIPLRVAQVADWGYGGAVVYVPGPGGSVSDAPPIAPAGKDVLTMRTPLDFGLRASTANNGALPSEKGAHAVRLVIDNPGPQPRDLVCRVFECVDAIDPLAFTRAAPEQDRWFPLIHVDPNLVDDMERITLGMSMRRGDPPDEGLYADMHLAPGAYRALARMWREVRAQNDFRATLRFTLCTVSENAGIVATEPLGEVTPFAVAGSQGWAWLPIGSFVSSGAPQRLAVTAHNDSGLAKAYADLGRIVFVRADSLSSEEPFGPVLETAFTADPQSERELIFSSSLGKEFSRRVDVSVYDQNARISRNVNLYIERGLRLGIE